jgi:hypothetical protein
VGKTWCPTGWDAVRTLGIFEGKKKSSSKIEFRIVEYRFYGTFDEKFKPF